MNKGDLIEKVAEQTGESKAGAARMVEAVLGCIVDGVHREEKVSITNFGTFKKKQRKARVGINPITKQPMEIKASTTVGFSPSETLRNGV
jgi:nucleoid DNA-binding protein